MSEENGKPNQEKSSKRWFFAKNSREASESQNEVNSVVKVLMDHQNVGNRTDALFSTSTSMNSEIVEPEVSTAFASGLASFLTSLTAITKFPRRQETTSVAEDENLHELSQASTSRGQKSILRENTMVELEESTRFLKMRRFWSWNPQNKTKKSIVFVDVNSRLSDSSLDSVVTLIATKPLKSALRSSAGSSGNSSVRFSLPETLPSAEKNFKTMRIGKFDFICEINDEHENTGGCLENWRHLRRTRICKIVGCLALGIIVPSLLVVPVLVYEESAILATSAG